MKTKSLVMTLVVGMLASIPAYAMPWFNSATYASRFRPAEPSCCASAKSQPAPAQGNNEVQVGVMAKSQSPPTSTAAGADIWYGSSPRSHATHSR